MKNLLLILLLALSVSTTTTAMEIDTLWYRTMGAGAQDVDFTPDDRYVIAWANGIEFWEVQEGVKEFFIPSETTGDFNFNEQYLVFAQDSTPKLLNWETREVVEGFSKMSSKLKIIKTAKSKNEFMATKGHHPKVIYFWDINQKQILDSFEITKEFEKDNQKWGRSIHEYDFVGNNDELFYIRVNDNNRLTPNLPTQNEIDNFSYLIYNRGTKELVDSLFAFQITIENYNHVDKMVIMKDRTKLAWNNKGGEINFYDIINKKFYDKLVFDNRDFIELSDIEFNNNETILGVSVSPSCCRYIKIFDIKDKNQLYQYGIGSWNQINFSNDELYFISSISGFLSLYPKHWIFSNNTSTENNIFKFRITPNPAINLINIEFYPEDSYEFNLTLIDLVGNEIDIIDNGFLHDQIYQKEYNISILPSGSYFIRLEIGSDILTKQFIKE